MQLPVSDINAQNQRMKNGKNSQRQMEGYTDGWIRAHQKTFDGWIAQAMTAAK